MKRVKIALKIASERAGRAHSPGFWRDTNEEVIGTREVDI